MTVAVELRPLRMQDVEAHNAGEDEATVRWLSGAPSTHASTAAHVAMLEQNAARGEGKRGFGVWLDGALAGYVDIDPDVRDGLAPDEANISYAVHPWARGRGVAGAAVELICAYARARHRHAGRHPRRSPQRRLDPGGREGRFRVRP